MRTFQCYDCGHTWEVPHGTGGMGVDMACPNCGSKNVHRAGEERGRGGWGRGGWGRGRGCRGGGRRPQGSNTIENT